MSAQSLRQLLEKYDIPAPRYTSYPTVPYWEQTPSPEQWIQHIRQGLSPADSSWSMYLHIPFCETLCTFCGCNNSITKDHTKGQPYVDSLLAEWAVYADKVPEFSQKPLDQMHLGGGTPTFLTPKELGHLLEGLFKIAKPHPKHFEGAVEVDPRRTTAEQLKVLREFGFNRVSIGVQDFSPEVQRLVNRIQPFDITAGLTEKARAMGYPSVNFDLIYGLAKQTPESMANTADQTVQLRPDRIALYSFALVPWIKPAQRLFKDEDLPSPSEKRLLYEIAREKLLTAGYIEVGMDHFALPTDGLALALKEKTLHRNFMGYTDVRTDVLLGMGVSAISESPQSFHQNEKVLSVYQEKVKTGHVPSLRGHILTEQDQARRKQILRFMTDYEVNFEGTAQAQSAKTFLAEMEADGLVEVHADRLKMTEQGKPFLRNACLFFDERLRAHKPTTQIFSRSI
jgi:oxygen-independent coproporphyrinogen-3 oxidase